MKEGYAMLHYTRIKQVLAALMLLLLIGTVCAQHPTFETGAIEATIDGAHYRAFTYATEVPESVVDGVTDPGQLAFLERIAGTVQHSASYRYGEPIMLGAMELVPAAVYVAFSTRTDSPEGNSVGSIMVQFDLDPETLELTNEGGVQVTFYPRGSSYDDYYALTEGSFELHSVEVVDENTMSMSGVISGLLSWQYDYDTEHNPDDTLTIDATFDIAQVVASDVVIKLLTE